MEKMGKKVNPMERLNNIFFILTNYINGVYDEF